MPDLTEALDLAAIKAEHEGHRDWPADQRTSLPPQCFPARHSISSQTGRCLPWLLADRAEAAEANVARIQNDMVTWLDEANLILQADDEVRRILYNRDRFGQPLPDQSRADGGVR